MILFEVPTPGRQHLFGLSSNRGSFPLLGYTSTLLRMPHLCGRDLIVVRCLASIASIFAIVAQQGSENENMVAIF